ncbi:MAG: hypothetical protein KAV87_13740 [Desulfobacteraceae bacterium]|nr:hypothetical protein [Desulfobacteraceae bacterium]
MLSSDESGIQKERYSRPFLKKLGDLFWNVPGKRHKLFHPALIMYFLILAWYSYLLLVPYNARLSPSDYLVYTRLAATDSPERFGRAGCERLSVLLPIRLLILVFDLSPAEAGKIVTLAIELLLVLMAMLFCHRLGGVIAGILAGCLLSCTTFTLLTTDIRADHFAVLFLVVAFLLSSESNRGSPRMKSVFIFLTGVALTLLSASKPNFIMFIPLFALPLVISRQWSRLLVLFSGVLAGGVFLAALFVSLYPKEIWGSYFRLLSISFSVYSTPHKITYSVYWYRILLNPKFYVLPLFIMPLFRYSYRTRGVRECFISSLLYFFSLMALSGISARMVPSDWYSLCMVIPLVMGSALVIAKKVNFHTEGFGKLLFLGFAVVGIFIISAHVGINQSDYITNVDDRISAIMYMMTPLFGIAFGAWLVAFNGRWLAGALMVALLAIPQTLLINAHSHRRFELEVRKFNDQFYSFTDRIPTRYLEKEPVLISLKEAPLGEKWYERYTPVWRYTMILHSRRYPIPKIGIFIDQMKDVGEVLKGSYYKSVITDDPGMIMEMCPVSYVQAIEGPDLKSKIVPLFYLEPAESSAELTPDYESQSFNWKGPESDYESQSFSWKGPDTIDMEDLARVAPPLMISGSSGDFIFKRVSYNGVPVIRIEPSVKDIDGKEQGKQIQFGYWLGRNGLDLSCRPGQEIVLSLYVRLSDETTKRAEVFVQDKAEYWERSSFTVQSTAWRHYVVSKRIRKDARDVFLGVYWEPNREEEWLEIKDISIFVEDADKPEGLIR